MKRPCYLFLLGFLFASMPLFAQLQKVTHKTFNIGKANTVQFDIYDDFEVELWPADNIMIETNIKLYEASNGILEFFIKQGRYEIDMEELETVINLVSKDKERRTVKTRKGECYEQVKHRVFLPDDFKKASDNSWSRKGEDSEELTKEDN